MLLVSTFHWLLIFQENKMKANHICLYVHNLHIHTCMCPYPHAYTYIYMCPCWHAQLCLTVCGPMDYCLSGSSVHGILQARVLEWVAILFSRGSSWSRNQTCIWFPALQEDSLPSEPLGKPKPNAIWGKGANWAKIINHWVSQGCYMYGRWKNFTWVCEWESKPLQKHWSEAILCIVLG